MRALILDSRVKIYGCMLPARPSGMRKQSAVQQKKRLGESSFHRAARRRALAIMAEEVRVDLRKAFKEASAITVAWDNSDGRKIVRARCDAPESPYRFDCVLGVMTTRLGAFQSVASEVNEDHAKLTHQYLEAFHRRFFTNDARVSYRRKALPKRQRADASGAAPPNEGGSQPVATAALRTQGAEIARQGGQKRRQPERRGGQKGCQPVATLDEEGLNSFRHKVRVLASDGGAAERRALFFSAAGEFYPNANLAIKDLTHCIRIATQKPLHIVSIYEEVYEEIVNKRHSLIPDIQNSNKWRNILQAIQVELLQMPSLTQQGCLKIVLSHLAFAKQRMDSCADPLAKVSLMLMPIALLLALISSDERNERQQRERAASLLSKMQPLFLHALGVSADWGIICLFFFAIA